MGSEGERRSGGAGRKLFAILLLLGGGGGAGWYFKAWDRYAPAWLQAKVGHGAYASPAQFQAEARPVEAGGSQPVRDAAIGSTVHWRAKVIEVRRPVVGGPPTVIARAGEALVRVVFPDEREGEVLGLRTGSEFAFRGVLSSIPPDEIVVVDASVEK